MPAPPGIFTQDSRNLHRTHFRESRKDSNPRPRLDGNVRDMRREKNLNVMSLIDNVILIFKGALMLFQTASGHL